MSDHTTRPDGTMADTFLSAIRITIDVIVLVLLLWLKNTLLVGETQFYDIVPFLVYFSIRFSSNFLSPFIGEIEFEWTHSVQLSLQAYVLLSISISFAFQALDPNSPTLDVLTDNELFTILHCLFAASQEAGMYMPDEVDNRYVPLPEPHEGDKYDHGGKHDHDHKMPSHPYCVPQVVVEKIQSTILSYQLAIIVTITLTISWTLYYRPWGKHCGCATQPGSCSGDGSDTSHMMAWASVLLFLATVLFLPIIAHSKGDRPTVAYDDKEFMTFKLIAEIGSVIITAFFARFILYREWMHQGYLWAFLNALVDFWRFIRNLGVVLLDIVIGIWRALVFLWENAILRILLIILAAFVVVGLIFVLGRAIYRVIWEICYPDYCGDILALFIVIAFTALIIIVLVGITFLLLRAFRSTAGSRTTLLVILSVVILFVTLVTLFVLFSHVIAYPFMTLPALAFHEGL